MLWIDDDVHFNGDQSCWNHQQCCAAGVDPFVADGHQFLRARNFAPAFREIFDQDLRSLELVGNLNPENNQVWDGLRVD